MVRWWGVIDELVSLVATGELFIRRVTYLIMLVASGHFTQSNISAIDKIIKESAARAQRNIELRGDFKEEKEGAKVLRDACANGLVLACAVFFDDSKIRLAQVLHMCFSFRMSIPIFEIMASRCLCYFRVCCIIVLSSIV